MEVIFIRHLPTPGNEKKQYIGRTDEVLSSGSVTSFHKKREMYLKSQKEGKYPPFYPPAEMIVASPMKRCVQTAELIYPGQKIVTEPELRECDFGRFEGKTYEELKDDPAYIAWLESGGVLAFPEGEDQETFRSRCVEGVCRWLKKGAAEKKRSIAFVVHGGTIMAALHRLAEGEHSFYDWQTGNGRGFLALAAEDEWQAGREILREIRELPVR
ncbi:MAG TPA: histidine phosphatase family protein [Candidatus Mediterraneibacter avicola]|nr:histidine phosphatase family protein [Candidatus Mediterraneibacter avicola]